MKHTLPDGIQQIHSLTGCAEKESVRIDLFLSQNFSGHSRTFFQKLIGQSLVTVNGSATKSSALVKANDIITVSFPQAHVGYQKPNDQSITAIKQLVVEIVYEHKDFLVIAKPPHLTVHKPSKNSTEITLVDWLLLHFEELHALENQERPGIVHRLDKDTSGLMIIARNAQAHAHFSDLFKNREIKKHYCALVHGNPPKAGSIDIPLGRDHFVKTKMAPHGIGNRPSITHFKVEEYLHGYALVHAYPVTGRTHQIRVHCATMGHPIVGDALYGKASANIDRQALHAIGLTFTYQGEEFSFTQELPKDFQELICKARSDKLPSQ